MDTEAVKACTLKRIVYPTGGYTDFDFETHDVNYTLGKIGIGGLRVKKITDNDENGNQKIRNYEYPYYSWGERASIIWWKICIMSGIIKCLIRTLIWGDAGTIWQATEFLPISLIHRISCKSHLSPP